MRIVQAFPIAIMALQASALQPAGLLGLRQSHTNGTAVEQKQTSGSTMQQTQSSATPVQKSQSSGTPVEQESPSKTTSPYQCEGSCVYYVQTQEQADYGNAHVAQTCRGACIYYVAVSAIERRFLSGSHERHRREVVKF